MKTAFKPAAAPPTDSLMRLYCAYVDARQRHDDTAAAAAWPVWDAAAFAAGAYGLAAIGRATLQAERETTTDPARCDLLDAAEKLTHWYNPAGLKEVQAERNQATRRLILDRLNAENYRRQDERRKKHEQAHRDCAKQIVTDAKQIEAKAKADAERREKAELAQIETNERQKDKAEQKPLVRFSKRFMRASCEKWEEPEERQRGRHANEIMRRLFENWRDHKNRWIPEAKVLLKCNVTRVEKAMSAKSYPRTFALVDVEKDNTNGKRKIRLSEAYKYALDG